MRRLLLIAAICLVVCSVPAMGASSFLGGFSGNIITPDAVVAPTGSWELSYHQFVEVLGDDDLTSLSAIYGIAPNFEVGVSFLDNSDSEMAINGKYRIAPETADRPAILVGVFDVAGTVDFLDDDPGFYLALSKNITAFASDVVDEPSRPLRLTAGFGSGVFDGFFAGLDWTLQPRLSVMAEFFGGQFGGDDNFFNAGLRYAATDNIRLDAATIDFDNFAFGASFQTNF